MEQKILGGTVTEDPFRSEEIGASVRFERAVFEGSNAQSRPDFVRNWGEFRGALLAVGFNSHAGFEIVGSAFIVAPGLALSATHVFADRLDAIGRGKEAPYALGIDAQEVRIWRITSVNTVDGDDIALLALQAASALPRSRAYFQFPLTTRTPRQGEILQIFGFRNEIVTTGFLGNLVAASGQVEQVHHHGRDRVLLPYPVIEISAGSHGGMSGGIAIDLSGHVLGVISLGMDSRENIGPTYLAWVVKALNRRTKIDWPPGLYPKLISLIEIDERLAMIQGRKAVRMVSEAQLQYQPWSDVEADALDRGMLP